MNSQTSRPLGKIIENLRRPDVTEVALATGRLPCAKVGGAFVPYDRTPLTMQAVVEIVLAAGGAGHIDSLTERPSQWKTRLDGVGVVAVAAVRRGDDIQARFAVTERDVNAPPPGLAAGELELDLERTTAAAPPPEPPARLSMDMPGTSAPIEIEIPPPAPVTAAASAPAAPSYASAPSAYAPATSTETIRVVFDGTMDSLLRGARTANASDMHVISERPLLLRIGGDLTPVSAPLDPARADPAILKLVPERLLASFEKDGSCDFGLDHFTYGRFRVNVARQRTGLKACFRLIPDKVPTLEELALPEALAAATHHHQGLIVVTGPTGHGKTTTLAAIVDLINRETSHHVITVEDPIEFVHPRKKAMMSQREVGTHTKSFRAALKGSLREDPDVIVIGELRDTETVRIALSASETGHLVIGTMNTPSAAKTIDRLIDLFPPGDQAQVRMTLAGGLKLVVSQRLVPTADKRGLFAAAEVLPGSMALWNLIRDSKTFQIPSLQQRGKGLGIIRLDDSLADLVRSGKTDLTQALAFAESPDELEAKVSGRPAIALPPGMGPKAVAPAAGAPAAPGAPGAAPAKAGLLGKAGSLFGKKGG